MHLIARFNRLNGDRVVGVNSNLRGSSKYNLLMTFNDLVAVPLNIWVKLDLKYNYIQLYFTDYTVTEVFYLVPL